MSSINQLLKMNTNIKNNMEIDSAAEKKRKITYNGIS